MQTENRDRVEIGLRIKQLRKAQSYTVHELAQRAKVSAGYISEVERGKSAVSIDKLTQIADGLKVGLDSLLGDASESSSSQTIEIPTGLSKAADQLNLTHRATLALLQGRRSLTARRSSASYQEWGVQEWIRFHEQVKDYLPEQ